MTDRAKQLLDELDASLRGEAGPGERLDLYQLGRMAVIQHFGSGAVTKDFDVLQDGSRLLDIARKQFGEGTENARRLGIYLEAVPTGIPPIPGGFRGRSREVTGPWTVIRLWRPDPNDLAATKLKRFSAGDRQDIQFLCDRGLIDPDKVRNALESAFIWSPFHYYGEEDEDPDRQRAFANLQRVLAYLNGEVTPL